MCGLFTAADDNYENSGVQPPSGGSNPAYVAYVGLLASLSAVILGKIIGGYTFEVTHFRYQSRLNMR
jgi:hypothetical protein